jgi:hypothetical protein
MQSPTMSQRPSRRASDHQHDVVTATTLRAPFSTQDGRLGYCDALQSGNSALGAGFVCVPGLGVGRPVDGPPGLSLCCPRLRASSGIFLLRR